MKLCLKIKDENTVKSKKFNNVAFKNIDWGETNLLRPNCKTRIFSSLFTQLGCERKKRSYRKIRYKSRLLASFIRCTIIHSLISISF